MRTTNLKTHDDYLIEQQETNKTQFLKEQTQCPICYGKLDIFVESINTVLVKEEARCTECMALSRVQDHCLH